ncbi:DUF3854 domain-containing protein [Lusitaniella coriacea LEGE 07157]|uniref:DUF3854 domain-containing protein n=1 Tax=Lusitaniella coriacea LEGE 07157 TaxID=945747 RepID=A0A8J7DXJ9_9CYAN|nr:plasmid replication protein, CyRepA1 family [Lusitaniella coriacea]MBE9117204.1 DUF3854 domain-containing protein [Lusitaniella coriacea LEGE 07157]
MYYQHKENSSLSARHRQEWLDSGVDPKLIELNVRSLDGFAAIESLIYALPHSERRNDGRIRDKWLKKYRHVEKGGWWCSGVDLLTFEEAEWGCFKPDFPRRGGKGKVIKYEHPPQADTELFALRVPQTIWDKIALRYGVKRYLSPLALRLQDRKQPVSFWEWIIRNPEIPILITEGAKKAGALLSAGFAAIALPGVFNGYRQRRDDGGQVVGLPRLIPQVDVLAKGERKFYFCFDQDEKPKTIENVNKAITKTGKLLANQGCALRVTRWELPAKGIDDVVATFGRNVLEQIVRNALRFESWQAQQYARLSYRPDVKLNQRYLDTPLPPSARLIALKSPKGTGKTEWLCQQAQEAIRNGQKVLVLTHRVQLGEALCQRFGIDYVTAMRSSQTQGVLGYGLCVDSLHPHSQARFDPEEWHDAVVIIDEAEQVFWHLLNSSTCQKERVAILRSLEALIQNVLSSEEGQVFLSDADLSDIALDFVRSLAGFPLKPYVIVNDWKPEEGWDVYTYETNKPRSLVAALVNDLHNGGVPLVCCSAQKMKSNWGTYNLECYLKKIFPNKKILRIDSETVSDPSHPACGCIDKLNEILPHYDIVLASPSIETGVSIDIQGHFTGVWGIAQGVQTADSVRQALARVREPIPRHLWAREQGFNGSRIGNGSTSIQSLLKSQHKLCRANIALLRESEFEDIDLGFQPDTLKTWAKRAVAINHSMSCYRQTIVDALQGEGHRIVSAKERREEEQQEIEEELKMTKDENYQQYCQTVAAAPNPDDRSLDLLQEKRSKTEGERLEERKGVLARRYPVEITPEVVERDGQGWYGNLQLHYYLTVGNLFLKVRDVKVLRSQLEQGEGAIWKPDFNAKALSAQVHALELLEIGQFLKEDATFTSHSLGQWGEQIKGIAWQVKAILGVTINQKDSPIAIAQLLLSKLGLKMPFLYKRGGRGKQQRVYGAAVPQDGREEIFERWFKRDEALAQAASQREIVVTHSNNKESIAEG